MKILDRLIGALRGCCHALPDLRQGGDTRYTMADMSAFSLFFLQSPSFPAPSGGGTGAVELPDAIRPRQDPQRQSYPGAPVSPDHFHPVFAEVVTELERSSGL